MRRWILLCMMIATSGCGSDDAGAPDAGPDAIPLDAPTGNATLSSLLTSVASLDPPFEPELTEYDLDLVLAEADLAITPTAAAPDGITLTVDGVAVGSGVAAPALALTPGSRDVDVVVTAAGGARITYTLHVHRGVDALAALAPSSGALAPGFDGATLAYDLGLITDTTTLTVTPTAMIPSRSAVSVENVAVTSGAASAALPMTLGDNPIDVTVTPTTRAAATYAIGAFRGIEALSAITLSFDGGAIANPLAAFDATAASYPVSVGLWLQRVQLAVTPLVPGATVTVAGSAVTTGQPSAPIALALGANPIAVVVTGAGGVQRTYTVAVDRAGAVLQQAYGHASNYPMQFGEAIAVSGDTLVVGAANERSGATGVDGDQSDITAGGSGAVYVFTRAGATWSQQAYIKASNTAGSDHFGRSVAIWGDTLVVGAPDEDSAATGIGGNQSNNGAGASGAVYVFTRTGTTWSQQAYLKASNTGVDDVFGATVALAGDTLAVGAPGESSVAPGVDGNQLDNTAPNAGAAYVFTRTGTTWSQQAYVKASNPAAGDVFGSAIALSGDTLAVGAWAEASNAVGIDGDQSNNSSASSGAVYVFTRTGTTWSQQAYVKASNTGTADQFGETLALWGNTLAVGARFEDSAAVGIGGSQASSAAADAGAVYVLTRAGTTWTQQAYVKASNTETGDGFGGAVALWGDTLAVTAISEDSAASGVGGLQTDNGMPGAGAAYVFGRSGTTWTQRSYVKASNPTAGDQFGSGLGLWGDTVGIGAHFEDSPALGVGGDQVSNACDGCGAIYILR